MQMIVPILIGVALLVGFVALYLSRETWRVYHIVIGFFLLIANVLFLYLAARVLDTHRQWGSEVRKYETQYATEHETFKKLTGELDGRGEVVVDRDEKSSEEWSIDDWKAELAEATYGRGRVLGLVPKGVDEAGVITAQSLQPDALPTGSSVHVFFSRSNALARTLPYEESKVTITTPPILGYVGNYIVSNVAGNLITLTPVHPERRVKIDGPLVIYEVAPVDTHEAFAHLTEQDIKQLLPAAVVPPEVVKQYLKDGESVPPKVADDPNNPDYNHIWRLVRFTKEHRSKALPAEEPAQPPADAAAVDVAEQLPQEDATPIIREMKFQPGDEAYFDRQTAAELVKSGVAEYVEPGENVVTHIYRRPLNDYPLAFREVRTELLATQVKLAESQRQIEAINKSIELAKQTQQLRQQESARLAQDLEKVQFEVATIQKLHDTLVTSVKKALEQIQSLQQSIGAQADELSRLQLKAAQVIERRTASTAQSAVGR